MHGDRVSCGLFLLLFLLFLLFFWGFEGQRILPGALDVKGRGAFLLDAGRLCLSYVYFAYRLA